MVFKILICLSLTSCTLSAIGLDDVNCNLKISMNPYPDKSKGTDLSMDIADAMPGVNCKF